MIYRNHFQVDVSAVDLSPKTGVLDNGDYHECDMESFGYYCCTTFPESRAEGTATHRDLPYAHLLQIGRGLPGGLKMEAGIRANHPNGGSLRSIFDVDFSAYRAGVPRNRPVKFMTKE